MDIYDSDQEHWTSLVVKDEEEGDCPNPGQNWDAPTAVETKANEVLPTASGISQQQPFDSYPSSSMTTTVNTTASAVSSKEINPTAERYQFLPEYAKTSFVAPAAYAKEEHESNNSTYDNTDDLEEDLPLGMLTPPNRRQRDIVRMTAIKCASAPQLEVFLKVRQADHVDFAFLQFDNPYHAYYRWLVQNISKTPQSALSETKQLPLQPRVVGATETNNGMQDLLGMYSSSSSEDEDDHTTNDDVEVNKNQKDDDDTHRSTTTLNDGSSTNGITGGAQTNDINEKEQLTELCNLIGNDNEKHHDEKRAKMEDHDDTAELEDTTSSSVLQARRLKRARLMSGHYRLRLMESSSSTQPTT